LFTPLALVSRAQSGNAAPAGRRIATLNVIVHAPAGRVVTRDDFDLYDADAFQEIESFTRLDTGSRIVLMVDNSASLKAEPAALEKAIRAIVNELYQDDQMMIVGYNESAEIVEDMTGELAGLQAAASKMIRKGSPNLYDALLAVADSIAKQANLGIEKRAIILISDGYDYESKTKFDEALRAIQDENIVLYALQVADRTRGALQREKPKPPIALQKLTDGSGGSIYPFDKAGDAARIIADDLRKNWYKLVYTPSGFNTVGIRRLLIISHDPKIALRTKSSHPPKYRPTS
jgi:VWFA-related protein